MSKIVLMVVTCAKLRDTRCRRMEAWLDKQPYPYRIIMGRGAVCKGKHDVIVNADDTYDALPYKVIEGLKHMLSLSPSYILKIDDDVIPHPDRFLTFMQSQHCDYEGKLHYKGCAGPVYLLSHRAASIVANDTKTDVNKSKTANCTLNEDIHVGNVLHSNGIRPTAVQPHMYIDVRNVVNCVATDRCGWSCQIDQVPFAHFYLWKGTTGGSAGIYETLWHQK